MPTAREKQVKDAVRAREAQRTETFRDDLLRAATRARYRYYSARGKGTPEFYWSTEQIEVFGQRGWASWVRVQGSAGLLTAMSATVELHKTRNGAKARAFNLYQGWLYAERDTLPGPFRKDHGWT